MPAKYREIESYLRAEAARGREGQLMPTTRALCEMFSVSGVQTVRNAYEPLKREGIVETIYHPRRRWVLKRVPPASSGDSAVTRQSEIEAKLRHLSELAAVLQRELKEVEDLISAR